MSTWEKKNIPRAKAGMRVAIVAAEFNKEYADSLLQHTKNELVKCGGEENNIDIVRVPGAFELPFACKRVMETKKYDVIIALGVVIRGETIHFELVANEAARGIMRLNTEGKIPIIFGILACENETQVKKRLKLGKSFAHGAIEMVGIRDSLHN